MSVIDQELIKDSKLVETLNLDADYGSLTGEQILTALREDLLESTTPENTQALIGYFSSYCTMPPGVSTLLNAHTSRQIYHQVLSTYLDGDFTPYEMKLKNNLGYQ